MSNKSWAALLIISTVLTVALTKYYWPNVQEKVVTVEKEVTHTVTRIVKSPDGTVVTEIDKHETETRERTKLISEQQKYILQVEVKSDRSYDAGISMRILGPIFVGINASTNKTIGATVSIMF